MKKLQFLKAGDYMKTITRAKYLDRIIELNGTPDIKIITGIRRSGKSKLMQAYIAYLKSNFENINIIFIDFMDLAYEEIKEYHALHAYVEEHYQEGKTNYLFVDEVQMCPKFELAINSLYSKGKYDIYVTGSNAFLLSADLATLFTGRYIEIHVFPFSFQEYCQYYDDISDKDKLFDEYAIKGGLAGSYAYRTEKDRTNYIKEVYETIVTRDLVQKYTLPDTLVLQRLSEFLMDNISNLTSPNKISQLKDLLYSLMLPSHNDTAVAIAEHVSGSTAKFVKLMNKKAAEIGCTNTQSATPNGLDAGYNHYTTASDLAKIAQYAIKKPMFRKLVSTGYYSFSNLNTGRSYSIGTTNALLGNVPGVQGMKTGYTNKAGYCFVGLSYSARGNTYISVVLGADSSSARWQDSRTLLTYAYNH